MGKHWRGKTQKFIEQNLPGSGTEQIGSAHHLVNAHQAIVDHHRELIGKDAIGAIEDKISYSVLDVLCDGSLQQVGEGDNVLVIDTQAQRWSASIGLVASALGAGKMAAGAGIAWPIFRTLLRRTGRLGNLGAAAIAGIDEPGIL